MPVAVESDIFIKGARVHNLKNIDLKIPRDNMIVVTGVSGSGKSSLAFDTLYAEGQRRYVESLSAYARQFLGRLEKPDVDSIFGIPPAVAIEQRVNSKNPRSTVGTSTEIYDYLKLLFARVGKTISPLSGREVVRHDVSDVVDFILNHDDGKRLVLTATVCLQADRDIRYQLEVFIQQGMTRAVHDGKIMDLNQIEEFLEPAQLMVLNLVVDRIVVKSDEDTRSRLGDSVQTAFQVGHGYCSIWDPDSGTHEKFSTRFELDDMEFEEPTEHLFSFNNPLGACPVCEGYGKVIGIDEDLVIPDKNLSIYDDAIVCWKGEKMKKWKERLILNADEFDFPIHNPYYDLNDDQRSLIWKGNKYFKGLNTFFKHLEKKKYKIQYRVMLSRYRGKTTCYECNGARLRKEALFVRIADHTIADMVQMPVSRLYEVFRSIKLDAHSSKVAQRLVTEITSRLDFMNRVGLGYLTLNRLSSTLSGGESQRINLATSLGSSLVGSLYILDEPSIGLHPRDTEMLISVLKNLRDLGNTVLIVEHDEEIMNAADVIIDMGPEAGRHGGKVVFQGKHTALKKAKGSLTADYLTEKRRIEIPSDRRKWNNSLEIIGARENNLAGIDVKIPLFVMTVVTGVSGSGKSTLIRSILFPGLSRKIHGSGDKPGKHDLIRGDLHLIQQVEFIHIQHSPVGLGQQTGNVLRAVLKVSVHDHHPVIMHLVLIAWHLPRNPRCPIHLQST